MTRRIAAQTALLAFTCALIAGLLSGNSATTVLGRALLALLGGLLVGQLISMAARALIRDHLQRRKMEIDRAYVASLAATTAAADTEHPSNSERG